MPSNSQLLRPGIDSITNNVAALEVLQNIIISTLGRKSSLGKDSLSDVDCATLLGLGRPRTLAPGAILYKQGDLSNGEFILLVAGSFDVIEEKTGTLLDTRSGREILGELAHVVGNTRTRTIRAHSELQAISWNMGEIVRLDAALRERVVRTREAIAFARKAQDLHY